MDYSKLELQAKYISNSLDFEANKDSLKKLPFYSYNTFLSLLRLGSEIKPAIEVSKEIFKISRSTSLVESEVLEIIIKSRNLNSIMDEQKFNS